MSHQNKPFSIFLSIFLFGCASSTQIAKGGREVEDVVAAVEGTISFFNAPYLFEDLKNIKQDATLYLNQACSSKNVAPAGLQSELDRRFNERFFSPWHQGGSTVSASQAAWGVKIFSRNLGFGENKREHSSAWIEELAALANLEVFPNFSKKAITVTNTHLRVLPTLKPHFNDFARAGEGYPFDNLQHSALWANTPIFVSHLSRDQNWVFAETPLAPGWVSIEDIAFVDNHFIKQWETGKYVALLKDKVAFIDDHNLFRFSTHIGAMFPYAGEDRQDYQIFVAIANENRQAILRKATVSKQVAVLKPLELSPVNIAQQINQMLGEPYGWGGLYENRDCSSATRDLFAPFGIWLPRNSAAQAKTGNFISLQHLPASQKERVVIQRGIPYLTLLWSEGHIMLYIGTHQGRALVFQNMWGVKTRDSEGEEGRRVVGQAVITSLQPGKELIDLDSHKGNVLKNLLGMTVLVSSNNGTGCR